MTDLNDLDPQLKRELERLKNVPPRDPQAAARGRERFLAEAAALQPAPRRNLAAPRKLAWNFAAVVLTLLLLFFGGAVGAAFASQNALPGEMLYPVKLAAEDLRLALAGTPQAEIDLLMQFAAVRVAEMNQLAAQGIVSPPETPARLEQHVHLALQLAAGLDDPAMSVALENIRAQLEADASSLRDEPGEPGRVLQQTRQMLQQHVSMIDEGLSAPEQFGNRFCPTQIAVTTTPTAVRAAVTPSPQGSGGTSGGDGQGQTPTHGPKTQTPGNPGPKKTPGPSGGGAGEGGKGP